MKVKFLTKLLHSGNIVCTVFTDIINSELASLGPVAIFSWDVSFSFFLCTAGNGE